MLWVFLIAAVGLAGIIAETWLSYRKDASQMQQDLARVRTGIRQHETATIGIEEKRRASDEHTAELRVESEKYTAEVELKRQELEELLEHWRKHHPGDPFDSDSRRI